jgi:hypothetical protein
VIAKQLGMSRDGWIEVLDSTGGTFSGFRAGTVAEMSDERQKHNWSQLPDNYIEQLAGIEKYGNFDWIDGGRGLGIGAQSLAKFLPRAVYKDDDSYWTVHYGGFAAVSVVELAKRVVQLEAKIKELTNDAAN